MEDETMTKKVYMKPTMQVVQLKQSCQLLTGSKDAFGMKTRVIDEEEVDEGF